MVYNFIKKAFADCDNCIALCANNQYMPLTAVAIQSILENTNANEYYDIIVLHTGINATNTYLVSKLNKDYPNVSIRLFNIAETIDGITFYTKNRKSISQETYYRLFLPWLLEEGYSKALYIDCDMIVNDNINNLINTDITQYMIAGVRDYWGICNCYMPDDPRREYRISIGLTNIDDYIIGGTILFNLNKMRKNVTIDALRDLISSYNWVQHDQDVVNVLCKDQILFVSPTWGFMTDYGNNHYLPQKLLDELDTVPEIPAIVHFGGIRKPYNQDYADYDKLFWQYCYHTPYFETILNKVKSSEYKAYIPYELLGLDIEFLYDADKNDIYKFSDNIYFGSFANDFNQYRIIKIDNDTLVIEGVVKLSGIKLDEKYSIYLNVGEEKVLPYRQSEELIYPEPRRKDVVNAQAFEFRLNIEDILDKDINLFMNIFGHTVQFKRVRFADYTPFCREFTHGYYKYKNKYIILKDNDTIKVVKYTKKLAKREEKLFRRTLKASTNPANKKALKVRKLIFFLKHFKKKPIWLITDRVSKADDCGEAFFRYVNKYKKRQINSYFVLSKNSPDYKRIKKIGKVIEPYSTKHKIIQLLTDWVFSAQTDKVFRIPFGKYNGYKDFLRDTKMVFLQHGVITEDLSKWLYKGRQDFEGFVVSANREYDCVVNGKYGYDKEVWLTGLTRFDYLTNAPKKKITFLPTWRKYLTVSQNHQTGVWNLKSNFENSTYATFYRNIMHNDRLRKACQEYGYELQFKIHPSFMGHEDKFKFDSDVKIVDSTKSYRDIYAESNLVITDYSSAINDFIYLKKPIIYTQFDKDEFFEGSHIYQKGTFDHATQGFGEVEYTLDSTVDRIIEYMQNDCQMKPVYLERVEKYFAHTDKNNCQRLYDKVMEYNKLHK